MISPCRQREYPADTLALFTQAPKALPFFSVRLKEPLLLLDLLFEVSAPASISFRDSAGSVYVTLDAFGIEDFI